MTPSFVLLVTWFLQGQPPSSYQSQFNSLLSCQVAQRAVEQQRDQLKSRMVAEAISRNRPLGIPDYLTAAGVIAPEVTAVCVGQN